MANLKEVQKKVVLLGDSAVGKTSLIRRFVFDKFSDRYIATIGSKITAKELRIITSGEKTYLKLQIWDLLGQREFVKLQKAALKGANGAFIVVDVTKDETLDSIDIWLLSLYEVAGEIPVVVLANKNDLEGVFGYEEVKQIVTDYGFPFYLTSAKTGENVDQAFNSLGEMMIKPWKGRNITAQLEETISLEPEVEIEIKTDKVLTPLEVEDIILTRYCDLFDDPNFAMAIVREQYKRAGVNFKKPTASDIKKVVDYLIKAASSYVDSKHLKSERETYKDLISRINRTSLEDAACINIA